MYKHVFRYAWYYYIEGLSELLILVGITHGSNGHMDIPIFHTEEGRYLAKCKLKYIFKILLNCYDNGKQKL